MDGKVVVFAHLTENPKKILLVALLFVDEAPLDTAVVDVVISRSFDTDSAGILPLL